MSSRNEFVTSLVSEWYDPLYRFAYSLCQNPEDAMDLTQNAFLKMTRKIHTLRDRSKAKSWLFQTVRNEFVDEYRKDRRYPVQPIDHTPLSTLAVQEIPGRGLDARNIVAALGTLEERFRAPLALFYLQSFSYREIAEVLDIPIGTVMSRLRRGKDQLRERVENPGEIQNPKKEDSRNPIPFPKTKESNHG